MNLPERPTRWDIEQITRDRVQAIAACGFTERQARFLVLVMLHAGVFLERQYCAFAGITHGQKTHDFLGRLIDGQFARTIAPGPLHRGRLVHVHHKGLYALIGQPNNRHRKPADLGRLIERVMILDGILADREVCWLGAEWDKFSFFRRRVTLDANAFPHLTFGHPPTRTVRYFTDKLPIGIRVDQDPIVFLYLVTQPSPLDVRLFLWRHVELLRALPEWTLRLLAPGSLRKAVPVYLHAIREECTEPLAPRTVEGLQAYFRARNARAAAATEGMDAHVRTAASAFRAPRFLALYRVWQQHGDPVLAVAQSHVLRDKFARGVAKVECVELAHQYLHLSSLVGKS